ncbi:MAG: ABC transporter ATP-binding protein [Planctomycetes bacterium]|nr:ABC transporter ATP-binding protein [Planctomycetota bacterium]
MNPAISEMPAAPPLLTCNAVSKIFQIYDQGSSWKILFGNSASARSILALDRLTLTVPKGKMVGILGRNGAGKSTLLRVLGGTYAASSGEVRCRGDLGGIYELGGMGNPYLTGAEYAERFLQLQGVPPRQLKELVAEIREFAELDEFFEMPIRTYSSGMAARLYFAAATAVAHDVYLIDEVLSVGDQHFQNKCWRRIRDRLGRGASGILVTHDWTAILKLCEEAHIMDHGRIIQSGRAEDIVRSYLNVPAEGFQAGAQFGPELGQTLVVPGEPALEIALPVVLTQNVPVVLHYSIEFLLIGVGWEIIVLSNNLPVANQIGKYVVRLRFQPGVIAPGRYYLNAGLSAPLRPGQPFVGYDARGWLHGNRIDLLVEGRARKGCVMLPVSVKK